MPQYLYIVPNYKSCFLKDNQKKITSKKDYVKYQRLSIPNVKPTNFHAMGAIPEKDIRVITDCSKPATYQLTIIISKCSRIFSIKRMTVIQSIQNQDYTATMELKSP